MSYKTFLVCDRCGCTINENYESPHIIDGRHYCKVCWQYTDEYININKDFYENFKFYTPNNLNNNLSND